MHLDIRTFSDYVGKRYYLTENAFWALDEKLAGLSRRDQRVSATLPAGETAQRKAAHKAVQDIRSSARAIRRDIDAFKKAIGDFEASLARDGTWSAVMLYEILDIEYIPVETLDIPEELDCVYNRDEKSWKQVFSEAKAIGALPVRRRLATNKVRNHALDQALIACRETWKMASGGNRWSRKTLRSLTEGTDVLAGECENFVHDMLTANGFRYTFAELNGAWTAISTRKRRAAAASR